MIFKNFLLEVNGCWKPTRFPLNLFNLKRLWVSRPITESSKNKQKRTVNTVLFWYICRSSPSRKGIRMHSLHNMINTRDITVFPFCRKFWFLLCCSLSVVYFLYFPWKQPWWYIYITLVKTQINIILSYEDLHPYKTLNIKFFSVNVIW